MRKQSLDILVSVVREYNQAHELHLRHPKEVQALPNPLLDSLYRAALKASQLIEERLK